MYREKYWTSDSTTIKTLSRKKGLKMSVKKLSRVVAICTICGKLSTELDDESKISLECDPGR